MVLSLLRRRRDRSKQSVEAPQLQPAVVDIDLTRPDWDTIGDLAEDFDNKMELFMGFDDGKTGAERDWLMG